MTELDLHHDWMQGALMRYRLDEQRMSPTPFASLSPSLESAFANLAAGNGEVFICIARR
jgi:hypothetical protein